MVDTMSPDEFWGAGQPKSAGTTMTPDEFWGQPATLGSIAKQSIGALGGLMDVAGTVAETMPAYQAVKSGLGMAGVAMPSGGQLLRKAYGYVGLNPDEIAKPQNAPERIARAGFEALPWAVTGGGDILAAPSLLRAAGRTAAEAGTSFAAGAGGQSAAELAPEGYKPAATIAGSLIGGSATAGSIAGARGVGQAIGKFRQPLTAEGQETLAGQVLRRRAENPEQVLSTLSGEGLPEGAATPVVPGSKPTTFQLTGDIGLGSLEREAATRDPAAFMARRAEQNAARLDTLGGLQDAGSPEAVSAALHGQMRAIDDATQQSVDRALTEAQGMASGLGGAGTPEAHGAALRGALMRAENAARGNEQRLWAAVDPQGVLAVGTKPLDEADRAVYGNLSAAAQASMKPIEHQIRDVIGQYQAVEPFREITDLRSLVSTAMREELSTAGRTPAYARLSQLRGAIEESINSGVQERLAQEAQAVRAGQMRPEDSLLARIYEAQRDLQVQSAGTGTGGNAPVPPSAVRGLLRAESNLGTRPGAPGNGLGVAGEAGRAAAPPVGPETDQVFAPKVSGPRGPAARDPSTYSLLEYLASRGGLRPSADLQVLFDKNKFIPGFGNLMRKGGLDMDAAVQAAKEGGYLFDPADISGAEATVGHPDLYDLLGREARNEKQYRYGYEPKQKVDPLQYQHDLEAAARDYFEEVDIDPKLVDSKILDRMLQMMDKEHLDPSVAHERAVMESDEHAVEQGTAPEREFDIPGWDVPDEGGTPSSAGAAATPPRQPGGPPAGGPTRTGGEGKARTALDINFNQSAAERLATATQATKERAQTFAPFKSVMRREGQQGPFRLAESAVQAKIFHPGPTGAEDVANFRRAVGDTAALPLLRDYAAHSVRQAALNPDGTLDPARFARWQAGHAEAMRAFPELADRFSDAARATDAIGQAAAIRRDALEAAQQGVLGKLINARDPADVTRIIGGIFGARDAVTQMRNLVARVRGNPAAMEGLRKAIADHVMGKLVSNTEASASGRNLIKSDQFQTFVRQNAPALREVFTPDEVGMMQAVADDLNRANRSVTAVKLPGQSNTAQDITALRKSEAGRGESLFSKILKIHTAEEAGRLGGAAAGALFGPIGAWVGSTLGGLGGMAAQQVAGAARSAGLQRVDELVREALLHPEIARTLMQKAATPQQEAHVLRTLARRLGTISMYGMQARAQSQQRARGGKVDGRKERVAAILNRHGVEAA